MTYVATDLPGAAKTLAAPSPRSSRSRTGSEQPMVAANPVLSRVNGGGKAGSNNTALLAGVGIAALLALGGGTWALTHQAAQAPRSMTPAAAASVPTDPARTAPSVATAATPQASKQVASPVAARPAPDDRVLTSASRSHAPPEPIRSLRASTIHSAAVATDATPAPTAATPGPLSANLTPQPQAVTPPVISPAPETVEPVTPAAPATSQSTPTTTLQPAAPTTDAPSAPQPQ